MKILFIHKLLEKMKIVRFALYYFVTGMIMLLYVNSISGQQVDLGFDIKKLSSDRPKLNISILLDLSDRIDPDKYPDKTMEYYKRDIGNVQSISEAFLTHVMNKRIRLMDDRMQVFFDPLPANNEINRMVEQLKIELTRDNITSDKLLQIKTDYTLLIENIYSLALESNYFPGSDIAGFFKNRVKDYCIKDGYRNVLIILTDGYIYHENALLTEGNRSSYLTSNYLKRIGIINQKWDESFISGDYGFISSTSGLNNLEVLVLGLNPRHDSPYEEDIMKAYWSKWLEEMGVSFYELKTTDLPSNLDERIKEFIWKN